MPRASAAALESAIDGWRKVLCGESEWISPSNEVQWRRSLAQICERIIDRGRKNITAMSVTSHPDTSDMLEWRQWMEGNVELLWTEEVEVAEAVIASVLAGIEF